jgi:DNA-binding HxlR family transcriptional regulator
MKQKMAVIYLPSRQDLERWKSLSKGKGCSLSRFVYEMTERGIEERRVTSKVVPKVSDEMTALRRQMSDLRREVDLLKRQNSRLKEAQAVPKDMAKLYAKWIMAIFSMDANLKNDEVYKKLRSYTEQWTSKMYKKVLRDLIADGLIKESRSGLQWVKK